VAGHQALKRLRSIAQDADFDVTIDAESDSDPDLVVDADAEGADVLVGERGPV
jgi:predicted RNA-binding protein Jag